MSRKLIEYALVVLVAIIVSLLIIWIFWPPGPPGCTNCVEIALPQQRQECEKQFTGGYGAPRTLQAGNIDEYLIGFYDPALGAAGTGYTTAPTGYGAPTTGAPAPIAGFVIARARPQTSYDSSTGSYSSGQYNPATVPADQTWPEVRLAVVEFASPLRNKSVCSERGVKFFEDKFEAYCNLPTRFAPGDSPKQSYRVFVINDSNTPIEYCIVSNCDESHGKICQVEAASGVQ